MFSRNDYLFFLFAVLFATAGFVLMVVDPVANGFGLYTLWIAPPLLLTGFLLPVFGITGLKKIRLSSWRTNRPKHLAGFLIFIAALTAYLFTLEPTASLWDCSEFIASAYKLQVPHTPGTPLSLLIGRLFTMLSLGDVSRVALTLNAMSGVFSALAVYLVYHIIFSLGLQIFPEGRYRNIILILAAAGGSLILAFSDTFWFSAVEAETYGAACFFLLLLVWLILSGRSLAEPLKTRRLILIFYLAGLAYCVHPMCLLALPVLSFSWYTSHKGITLKNSLLCAAGLIIVLFINRFVAVGFFELAFAFDRFFVNSIHLPFYSGAAIMLLFCAFLFRLALVKLNRARAYVWSLGFLMLGFTPYLLLFIRSNHNPPIDESNPENLAMIKAYMNRESYPSSPFLFGPYFDSRIQDVVAKKDIYYKDKTEYKFAGTLPEYVYDSRQTFLPRMYSNDADHIEIYRSWTGLDKNEKPNFYHNLKFMFTYQLGHMYFRYLMWNFAGRESDVQHSKWLWPWERLSQSPFEKARNQYWMIPLLFGIAGAFFQCRRDPRGFVSVATFFLITGLILALYLNGPPNEPRERDYIYVGSFIAVCIWIGLGFLSLAKYMMRFGAGGVILFTMITVGAPLWMLYQNHDDHDRSGRTFQVDNARNILSSCAPNSILFTGGDNDTFPLWYVQEVEGFRTDVRVMVLSYMNTDWYINQLRNTYYDSGAFKLGLDENDYRQYGPNDVLYVQETIKDAIDVRQFLALLKNEHPALRMLSGHGEPYHIVPSRTLKIEVSPVLPVTLTKATIETHAAEPMTLKITENYLSKNLLAILDLIVSNQWERPIYFNFTSLNTLGIDLTQYAIQEGPVFRLQPEKNNSEEMAVDTDLSFRNIVENADYSNLKDPTVHFSYEDHYARMIVPIRVSFNELASAFLRKGNEVMALKVLQEAIDKLYYGHLRPSYTNIQAAEILVMLNEDEKADSLTLPAYDYYYKRVSADQGADRRSSELDLYLLRRAAELLAKTGSPSYLVKLSALGI